MAFAPDVHVFPGGAVDPGDGDDRLVARSPVTPVEAAVALGDDLEPVAAIAAWIAAIREVFEEAGVLLG
jgi:8-oxo-dGTP pyrophosphatase MutT (NUDIX family)